MSELLKTRYSIIRCKSLESLRWHIAIGLHSSSVNNFTFLTFLESTLPIVSILGFFCLKHLENKRTINYKISYHSILRPHGRGLISHKRGKLKKKFFSTPTHVGKRKKCIVVISTKEGVTNMTVKWPRIFLGYLSHSGYLLSSVVS